MENPSFSTAMRTVIDLMREFQRETTAAQQEGELAVRVMQLFREEDIQGISLLMEEQKLTREFRDDLAIFVERWQHRLHEAEQGRRR